MTATHDLPTQRPDTGLIEQGRRTAAELPLP
ncbi:MAG: hypothetical protein QOC98_1935, partial [Frankiaceae bacterium]|nr:hypothetical protein [Frankiaceae bacterium]